MEAELEQDVTTSNEDDHLLIQVLDKIDASSMAGPLGKHYRNAHQCTRAEFMDRVAAITALWEERVSPVLGGWNNETTAPDFDAQPRISNRTTSQQMPFNCSTRNSRYVDSIPMNFPGSMTKILAAWVPLDGIASTHPVSTRLWGSLDTITRVGRTSFLKLI